MALVIPQLTFALMACMALKSIMDGEVEDGDRKPYIGQVASL